MELELEKKLDEAYSKLKDLREKLYFGSCTDGERDYIFKSMKELYSIIENLECQLEYLKRKIEITDGEIELTYLEDNTSTYKQYNIYLCGNSEKIGFIEYRDCDSLYLGNIGYHIYSEYNGHNFASKAVNLLNEILRKEGIESVVITANRDNIASIKTIEKVGGKPIDIPDDYTDIVAYSCDTGLKKQK